MTAAEYAEYERDVQSFFAREQITNLTRVESCQEEYFSGRPCDCCGTRLAGSRVDANGWNPTDRTVQNYVICTDCEYYAEYGQLDDQTMLDIGE